MLGNILNALTIMVGGLLGHILGKRLKDSYQETIMQALALVVFVIAISLALEVRDAMQLVISLSVGALLGELLDIEGKLKGLGDRLEKRFGEGAVSRGFVSGSLLFCMGSMGLLGSIRAGTLGELDLLYQKSFMDFIASFIMASSLGIGVMLSGVSVLIYQGSITLLAMALGNFMSPELLTDMSALGGVLLLTITLNILFPEKIRSGNLLPALIIPPLWHMISSLI